MIPAALAAILAMAAATYLTRVSGYLLLRRRTLGPRAAAVLDAVPGCVIAAMVAPAFVTRQPADLAAMALTLAAAARLPALPTVLIGMVLAALLRHLAP